MFKIGIHVSEMHPWFTTSRVGDPANEGDRYDAYADLTDEEYFDLMRAENDFFRWQERLEKIAKAGQRSRPVGFIGFTEGSGTI